MKRLKLWIVVGLVIFALWPAVRFGVAWYWLQQAETSIASVPSPAAVSAGRFQSRADQAVEVFKQRQLARVREVRNEGLRRQGLAPPRPLRQGEICVGGSVVSVRTVAGVPTYVQVLEQGLRVSCSQ